MVKLGLTAIGDEWKPVKWQEMPTAFERDLARLIGIWTQELVRRAKLLAPVDSGKLRASINGRVVQLAGQILGLVGTNAKHGPFMEFGTGLYSTYPGAPRKRIVAKNGKALKIPIGRFGSIALVPEAAQAAHAVGPKAVQASIFRMSIRGAHPQPFLGPLLADYAPKIQADLDRLCAKHGFK